MRILVLVYLDDEKKPLVRYILIWFLFLNQFILFYFCILERENKRQPDTDLHPTTLIITWAEMKSWWLNWLSHPCLSSPVILEQTP